MNNEKPDRSYKRYDEAFKRSAVELWLSGGKSAEQVAAELGINVQTLKTWKRQLGVLPPSPTAPRTIEQVEAENQRLRRELQSVIRQREILKKTLGILSTPSEPGLNE